MASRRFDVLRMLGIGRVRVAGSFRPDGTSTTLLDVSTRGVTVTRNGSPGNYLLTFDDSYSDLVAVTGGVRVADDTATLVQFGDYNSTAKTLQMRVLRESAGAFAPADLAADVDNVVTFDVTFRNSSVRF